MLPAIIVINFTYFSPNLEPARLNGTPVLFLEQKNVDVAFLGARVAQAVASASSRYKVHKLVVLSRSKSEFPQLLRIVLLCLSAHSAHNPHKVEDDAGKEQDSEDKAEVIVDF